MSFSALCLPLICGYSFAVFPCRRPTITIKNDYKTPKAKKKITNRQSFHSQAGRRRLAFFLEHCRKETSQPP